MWNVQLAGTTILKACELRLISNVVPFCAGNICTPTPYRVCIGSIHRYTVVLGLDLGDVIWTYPLHFQYGCWNTLKGVGLDRSRYRGLRVTYKAKTINLLKNNKIIIIKEIVNIYRNKNYKYTNKSKEKYYLNNNKYYKLN